jgi:hypothetical protein
MTEGATALITDCALCVGSPADDSGREPTPFTRIRVQRFEEKSYAPGTKPGTPHTQDGAYQLRAFGEGAEDRVSFKVTKSDAPNRTTSKVYSPVTGAENCAYDVTDRRDVPASITETACSHMVVCVADSVAGHVYRYHWRATTLV